MSWAGHVPQLEAMWTSTWAEVAPKQVQLVAKLRHVGPKLGPSWSHVGWAQVGPKFGLCWPMLRTCGVETVHLDDAELLGRYAKCANYCTPS